MGLVLKVAAGVLLGGGLLVGGTFGVLALTNRSDDRPPDRTSQGTLERLEAEQRENPVEPRDGSSESDELAAEEEAADALAEAEEVITEAGDEWCESKKGDQLAQYSSTVENTLSARRTKKASDQMIRLAKDASPGAQCAIDEMEYLAHIWNQFSADREYRPYEPRKQVKRVRAVLKELEGE